MHFVTGGDSPGAGAKKAATAAGIPVPAEIEEAFRALIRWIGDDPDRSALVGTPVRAARAWFARCSGYEQNPAAHLQRSFAECAGYDDIVLLRDIPYQTVSDRDLMPVIGTASIAYLPGSTIVGISKLAKVLQLFARRLQSQERLTAQVANCIWESLEPLGVAVILTARDCNAPDEPELRTSQMLGCFRDDPFAREQMLAAMGF